MCIKSALVAAVLFQNVLPSASRTHDPWPIFMDELYQRYPHGLPGEIISIRYNSEIATKQLVFGDAMSLIEAISMTTGMTESEIHRKMPPSLSQPGSAVDKVLNRHLVNPNEGKLFLSEFFTAFPLIHIDIFQVCPHSTDLCITGFGNPSPVVPPIKLFAQLNERFRPIIHSNIPYPHSPFGMHHSSPLPPPPLVQRINDWKSSTIPPKRQRKSATLSPRNRKTSDSRYNSNNDKSDKPTSIHITHNHYNQNVEGKKSASSNNNDKEGIKPVKSNVVDKTDKDNDNKQSKPSKNGKGAALRSKTSVNPAKGAKGSKVAAIKGSGDKKKDNTKWIVGAIIAAVAVVAGVCGGIYAFMSGKKPQAPQPSAERTEANNV